MVIFIKIPFDGEMPVIKSKEEAQTSQNDKLPNIEIQFVIFEQLREILTSQCINSEKNGYANEREKKQCQ